MLKKYMNKEKYYYLGDCPTKINEFDREYTVTLKKSCKEEITQHDFCLLVDKEEVPVKLLKNRNNKYYLYYNGVVVMYDVDEDTNHFFAKV